MHHACTLTDNYTYGKNEKRSKLIPIEPICRPEYIQKKLRRFKIFFSLGVIISCIAVYFTFLDNYDKQYEAEHYNNTYHSRKRSNPFLLITTISGFILIYIGNFLYTNNYDKKLRSQYFNPEGYEFQGKVFSYNDIHFLQHLEYYKQHNTWTIPEYTDLTPYTPDDPDNYLKPLKHMDIKDITGIDLLKTGKRSSASSGYYNSVNNESSASSPYNTEQY